MTLTEKDVKTIDVNVLEWFDKANGNSYFAGEVVVNFGTDTETRFNLPFQYGYGNHFEDIAKKELVKRGFIINTVFFGLYSTCKESGIILRMSKKENCSKRELKQFDN